MINLADLIMFGNGVRRRLVELAAMDPADADMGLADVDIPNLLVQEFLRQRFVGVGVDLA